MKNILKKLGGIMFVVGMFAFGGGLALAATPAYVSQSAANITATGATLNGAFNPKGLPTNAWFEIQNQSTKYGYQNLGSGTSNITATYTLTGLNSSTSYSFRAVAENTTGTTYGSWMTFTTTSGNTGCTSNCNPCTYDCNPCTYNCNPTPAPTVNLSASQNSIYAGDSVNLSWSSTNATSCSSSWGGNSTSGSKVVYPTSSRTYTITCYGAGGSASDSVYVTVNQIQVVDAPTVNLSASPTSVSYGGTTNLTWNVSNATSCVASNGWTGSKNANGGSQSIGNMTASTTFSITCTGPGGSASDSVYVSVASQPVDAPTVNLSASPTSVSYGGTTNLTWNVSNATSCVASNGWTGSKNANGGSQSIGNMTASTTFSITCTGPGGSASDSVYVSVNSQPVDAPTVNLSASPTSVSYGGTTNLTWNVSNATSCVASNGWTGSKNANGGSQSIGNMTASTTFSITCTGPGGSASDSVYVSVNSQPIITPTVITNSPSGINTNSAILNGTVSANGGSNVTAWFEWGSNTSMTNQTNQINYGSANNTNYSYSLGGLQTNTTYYYRAVAQNTNGQIVYGSQMSFSTTGNTSCTYNCYTQLNVTTYSATDITPNSAILNGYVDTNNNYVTRWFEYGTSGTFLPTQTNKISQGTVSGNFNQIITNLSPNTTYYFRASAQGNGATVYGNILTFTTTGGIINQCNFGISCAPTAITTLATNVDQNSARLNGLGLINGNVSTNGYFEYGETQSLGRTTVNNFIGNSPSSPFYSSLFGLRPNTTYYFRAVVTNQYGTSRGDIQTFRTNTTGIVSGVSTQTNVVTKYVYKEVIPVTNVITTTDVGVSKPSLVFLTINRNDEVVSIGNTYEYLVNYKNVSGENLRDLVLRVVLPKELSFVNASRGYYSEENNTVVVNISNLYPQEEGSVAVRVSVNNNAEIGKTIVVTANMVYTIVNTNVQEEVFAYSKNTIAINNGVIAGAALFGNGFFPTTLIGWLVLLLIILLIILAIRMAYLRREVRVIGSNHPNHNSF